MNKLKVDVLHQLGILEKDAPVKNLSDLTEYWLFEEDSAQLYGVEMGDERLENIFRWAKYATGTILPYTRIKSRFDEKAQQLTLKYRDAAGEDHLIAFDSDYDCIDDVQVAYVVNLIETTTDWRIIDVSNDAFTVYLCLPKAALE